MRANRSGDQRQFLVSADDTVVQITSPCKRHFVITGSGVLYRLILPDARAIPTGTPLVFENWSNEFVGVYNVDRTTWHRIPPRGTLYCTLLTKLTESGTWDSYVFDPAQSNPRYGMSLIEDFLALAATNQGYGALGLWGSGSGSGYAMAPCILTVANTNGRQGLWQISTGTTTTGYALSYAGAANVNTYLGGGCRAIEFSQCLDTISAVAEEYIARFCLVGNNSAGAPHTEGCGFVYDRLNSGTNWQFKTARAAGGVGSTTLDTGVAPVFSTIFGVQQNLRIEISSNGARADAWIDQVLVTPAGGQGNLPATTTAIKIAHWGMTKSAGTTNRYSLCDWVRLQSHPLALR